MLEIYIALGFVVVGVVFLIYSTKAERVTVSKSVKSKKRDSRESRDVSKEDVVPGVEISSDESGGDFCEIIDSDESSGCDVDNQGVEVGVVRESERLPEVASADSTQESGGDETVSDQVVAALYEDFDSVVSFNSVALSSINQYDKLKRLGAGVVVVGDEGISIMVEKVLYRFDFSRITKIIGKGSGVLIQLDTMDFPLLIVAGNSLGFADRLVEAHRKYVEI